MRVPTWDNQEFWSSVLAVVVIGLVKATTWLMGL